jgi:hypothetical protein
MSSAGHRTTAWVAIVFFVASLFYLGTASRPALLDDDVDAAHAVVAREMLERHDYIVLHMNGVPYLVRPPLHFWMIALSYTLLGQTAFATHLPLALTVVALLLLVAAHHPRGVANETLLVGKLPHPGRESQIRFVQQRRRTYHRDRISMQLPLREPMQPGARSNYRLADLEAWGRSGLSS